MIIKKSMYNNFGIILFILLLLFLCIYFVISIIKNNDFNIKDLFCMIIILFLMVYSILDLILSKIILKDNSIIIQFLFLKNEIKYTDIENFKSYLFYTKIILKNKSEIKIPKNKLFIKILTDKIK